MFLNKLFLHRHSYRDRPWTKRTANKRFRRRAISSICIKFRLCMFKSSCIWLWVVLLGSFELRFVLLFEKCNDASNLVRSCLSFSSQSNIFVYQKQWLQVRRVKTCFFNLKWCVRYHWCRIVWFVSDLAQEWFAHEFNWNMHFMCGTWCTRGVIALSLRRSLWAELGLGLVLNV